MAQHNVVEATQPAKRYTRADSVALRYRLNGLSLEVSERVYSEDDLEARGIRNHADLNAWLKDLLAMLLARAKKANPLLATHLENAQKYNRWPAQVVTFLIAAGEEDYSVPKPDDTLTEWLRPKTVAALRAEGIDSPGALMRYIGNRGTEWFRAIPRIGAGKARTLEHWLRRNEKSLGRLVIPPPPLLASNLVELTRASALIPLERISRVSTNLNGAVGLNRNTAYCLISARDDLEAIHAYLLRFRDRPPTLRAYQKELERFLLWCVLRRGIAMSSALNEDCEAYKAFLAAPDAAWMGSRTSRKSSAWRPFAGHLEPQSQRYAVQALRTFFAWLANVRYLGGNPWVTVTDPAVATKEVPLNIEKAVPRRLWLRIVEVNGILDQVCDAGDAPQQQGRALHGRDTGAAQAQYRLVRAAMLLIGFSGIRREEASTALRDRLRRVTSASDEPMKLWELEVLGKRKKWRTVHLPERAIAALRAHWADRGHDFDAGGDLALLSPVTPATASARRKHLADDGVSLLGKGFSPDGLYQVVKTVVTRMAADEALQLDEDERQLLKDIAPHALRHTFATHAVARQMPTDVLQRLLGHASLSTTTIYVRSERDRTVAEYAKYLDTFTP